MTHCPQLLSTHDDSAVRPVVIFGSNRFPERVLALCGGCARKAIVMGIAREGAVARTAPRPADWRSRFGFRRRADRQRERWAARLWVRA